MKNKISSFQVRCGGEKEANATVYLMEELGDARLRCAETVAYVSELIEIVDALPKQERERVFEVAGHLVQAFPETVFKLEMALKAVALAASKMDYEELKQDLRPEKVDKLEEVLEEVRIRPVRRQGLPAWLTPPTLQPDSYVDITAAFHLLANTLQESDPHVLQELVHQHHPQTKLAWDRIASELQAQEGGDMERMSKEDKARRSRFKEINSDPKPPKPEDFSDDELPGLAMQFQKSFKEGE